VGPQYIITTELLSTEPMITDCYSVFIRMANFETGEEANDLAYNYAEARDCHLGKMRKNP
jgi:hypothetical protein